MDDEMLRTINPVPSATSHLDADVREALLLDIMTSTPTASRTRRRAITLSAIGGSIFVLGGGAAFALGVFQSPSHEALTYCALPGLRGGGGLVDVAGPTGDPVENCRFAWRQATGEQPPALVAYQHPSGRVEVYPADQPVPEGYQRLSGGTQQDPELIALDEAFGDYVDGLAASCLDEPQARAKAASIIDRAGVDGWPVAAASTSGGNLAGTTLCWQAAANPNDHSVHVGAAPADPADAERAKGIADALRPSLTECWSMETAVARVQHAIAQSDFPDDAKRRFPVRQVNEAGASCTTVHVSGGGTVTFTLRGPA